jgi:hypothetical protein
MSARPRISYPPATGQPPFRRKAVRMPSVNGFNDLPVDGDAPERRRAAAPLNRIVARLLQHYHLRLSDNLDSLLADWPELAGPGLAAQARPGKLERGILYVYARNSAELFEIRRFKLRDLEARVKQHPNYKTIRQIRLQLDPGDPAAP